MSCIFMSTTESISMLINTFKEYCISVLGIEIFIAEVNLLFVIISYSTAHL